ncbi:MAG: hypothetical protein JWQ35_2363 [Bacteriovoracaceae bacterium]|nr:hypothetical protein [Bacteriovoracaceae bacterium]
MDRLRYSKPAFYINYILHYGAQRMKKLLALICGLFLSASVHAAVSVESSTNKIIIVGQGRIAIENGTVLRLGESEAISRAMPLLEKTAKESAEAACKAVGKIIKPSKARGTLKPRHNAAHCEPGQSAKRPGGHTSALQCYGEFALICEVPEGATITINEFFGGYF